MAEEGESRTEKMQGRPGSPTASRGGAILALTGESCFWNVRGVVRWKASLFASCGTESLDPQVKRPGREKNLLENGRGRSRQAVTELYSHEAVMMMWAALGLVEGIPGDDRLVGPRSGRVPSPARLARQRQSGRDWAGRPTRTRDKWFLVIRTLSRRHGPVPGVGPPG